MIEIIDRTAVTLPVPDPTCLVAALGAPGVKAEHDRFAQAVEALSAIEIRVPAEPLVLAPRWRVAAWNAERCKHVEASAALLRATGADIMLLSELDCGMARSGNRHTIADLAAALGMGYAYGVEFVELGLGDPQEQAAHAGERNAIGFHGNGILSRAPLTDLTLIRLDAGGRWFNGRAGTQRRLGGRMAIAGRIGRESEGVIVVSLHLESDSDARDRAQQMTRLLAALNARYGNARMVIGGDCNTAALPPAADAPLWRDRCETYEPLFAVMERAGFDWRAANDTASTQRRQPDRTAPHFRRIDWLFTRGLTASAPRTVAAVDDAGAAISDHEAITTDLRFE